MKKLAIILLILCSTSPLLAQRADRQYDKEKLEAARVAFITNRINLTASQAEKFWPLFNEHMEERGQLMREMSEINRKASDEMSDRQATELMEKRFELQGKMLDQEKSFMRTITNVISPAQALQLTNVHREFTRQLYRMQRGPRGSRHNN
jgi:phage gpG-like protein